MAVVEVTTLCLKKWPLPMPSSDGDKNIRGCILIIGGSHEMPGAAILAADAAMRAGAGKLAVATGARVAPLVAQAVPEARVIGMDETSIGGIRSTDIDRLPNDADCVLIGPGMQDDEASCSLTRRLLARFQQTPLVLDAIAMNVLAATRSDRLERFTSPVLLTPHAGELAHLCGQDKKSIENDPMTFARQAAARWNAVVALKGAITYIASPDGEVWKHEGGNVGLAISGSGDTLAGIAAGLVARGASLAQAAVWAVALHARAGERLAEKHGPLGYLAREIAAQIPRLMHALNDDQEVSLRPL